jgi:hypothetical protein
MQNSKITTTISSQRTDKISIKERINHADKRDKLSRA